MDAEEVEKRQQIAALKENADERARRKAARREWFQAGIGMIRSLHLLPIAILGELVEARLDREPEVKGSLQKNGEKGMALALAIIVVVVLIFLIFFVPASQSTYAPTDEQLEQKGEVNYPTMEDIEDQEVGRPRN